MDLNYIVYFIDQPQQQFMDDIVSGQFLDSLCVMSLSLKDYADPVDCRKTFTVSATAEQVYCVRDFLFFVNLFFKAS